MEIWTVAEPCRDERRNLPLGEPQGATLIADSLRISGGVLLRQEDTTILH